MVKMVPNYRSYPKNKTGYPFFWTTLYTVQYVVVIERPLLLFSVQTSVAYTVTEETGDMTAFDAAAAASDDDDDVTREYRPE